MKLIDELICLWRSLSPYAGCQLNKVLATDFIRITYTATIWDRLHGLELLLHGVQQRRRQVVQHPAHVHDAVLPGFGLWRPLVCCFPQAEVGIDRWVSLGKGSCASLQQIVRFALSQRGMPRLPHPFAFQHQRYPLRTALARSW